MNGPLYTLDAVRQVYGGRVCLDLPRLELAEGCISAVVGPNGAGKSTLFRLLALLEPPAAGALHFRGQPAAWSGPRWLELRRQITLLHQSPYLFRGTVADNVLFGLQVRGNNSSAHAARLAEALDLVDLSGFARRSVASLSGGEIQRVALARALIINPQVLLMDEPFANVDAGRISRIEALIREISLRGSTVIFSTHNLGQAHRLSASVIALAAGRPAEFGHENIFSGPVRADARGPAITLAGGLLLYLARPASGRVTCSVPPEAIRIHPAPDAPPGPHRFPGEITRLERHAGVVRVRVDGPVGFRVALADAEFKRLRLELGAAVILTFDPNEVRILEGTP